MKTPSQRSDKQTVTSSTKSQSAAESLPQLPAHPPNSYGSPQKCMSREESARYPQLAPARPPRARKTSPHSCPPNKSHPDSASPASTPTAAALQSKYKSTKTPQQKVSAT